MLVRLPKTVEQAREHLTEGAVPIGGATLVWATWQRDGFPEQAMSLRELPQANVIGPEELGGAVVLSRIDDRVPYVLRAAAGTVGTGAVRRAATVGGNLAGSALRCLLPAALVLEARATVLASHGVYETDLAEVTAKRPLLLGLRWTAPVASAYHKAPGEVGGEPPLVVATALHTDTDGRHRLRAAVRDGYEVLTATAAYGPDAPRPLDELRETPLADVPGAWDLIAEQIPTLVAAAPHD
ncbi:MULTISPECIES: FAD binding domain-containing protein [unclassified Streptomyces]|uniref:FAD binding domain-containing protein n=1 Tax=unclassified Streptomyces TaxID=2593676 RepID=UPI0013BB88E4|nr:FAD dependent dehydrogenase [Streptomyces sp. SID89]NED32094.1 FAD dependent dehydrogenase [Streptomyces sp. SID8499]